MLEKGRKTRKGIIIPTEIVHYETPRVLNLRAMNVDVIVEHIRHTESALRVSPIASVVLTRCEVEENVSFSCRCPSL